MPFPVIFARSFVVLCLALLCACASIPLSTALRLSSLDERALVQLDPVGIRVKVAIPRGNTLDPDATRLTLQLQLQGEGPRVATMPLRLLGTSQGERSPGMLSRNIAVTTYELALNAEGTHQLRDLQRELLHSRGDRGKVELSVNTSFPEVAPGTKEMIFWVDVKLRSNDAYLTLFDGAKIRFKMAGS